MRRPILLAAAAVVLVALTAASCGHDDKGISVAGVSRSDVTEVVDAPASVVARAAATLTAPADGTLARLAVNPGDQVHKGQIVAVVDSPTAQKRLRDAKSALDAARNSGGGGVNIDLGSASKQLNASAAAAFDQARQAADHVTDPQVKAALLAQIGAAQKQFAGAAKSVDSAVRGVQRGIRSLGSAMSALGAAQRLQAQQAYDLAKATVDALTLRAPIAGVVQLGGATGGAAAGGTDLSSLLAGVSGGSSAPAAANATPAGVSTTVVAGGLVSAGTPILTIVDVSELGLVADVDETDIFLVKTGVPADVELDAAPGVTYPAIVTAIDILPTPNARGAVAYRVRLSLQSPPSGAQTPRPGMNAVAHLRVREAADTVAVPAAAVFSAEGHDMVWVRAADGKAERRPVTVGVSGADLVQITDGLLAGDQVVVTGVDKVHSGDQLP
ncbi:efflux RND transporter periplasmic adaptor subunit [Hamadaea tsunoensis]|uniref:efflux RND transporter periplasmic adaptor subunit n=1 Tax=Hamadaea tsunoensis TaxID=53368 RepID=UPI000419B1DA|nr:efflux RND transporter periplasmic adaptor subunit [Hamadaea tsunoensis]